MIKKRTFLLILILSLQFGCASKTKINTGLLNTPPLKFNASFNLDIKSQSSDKDIYFYVGEDKKSLSKMWNEVTKNYAILSENPDFYFDITLLHTNSVTYSHDFSLPGYYAGALFELKVYNKNHELIQTRLFKSLGVWKDGLSLKGPVTVSAFNWGKTTRQAVVKLGLLDILSYVSEKDFAEQNKTVNTVYHIAEDIPFRVKGYSIFKMNYNVDLMKGDLKKNLINMVDKYDPAAASIIYFWFIMGEDYTSFDDIKPSVWTNNKRALRMVSKIGHDNNWPLFPKDLDVSSVPYSFSK